MVAASVVAAVIGGLMSYAATSADLKARVDQNSRAIISLKESVEPVTSNETAIKALQQGARIDRQTVADLSDAIRELGRTVVDLRILVAEMRRDNR